MAKDRKKLQHIHSSVLNKIPNSGVLLPGEIAVNTNPNNEFLSIENAGGNTVRFSSDLQLVDWMERKEVIPSEGEVVNKNLATNESEIKVTLNQKVGDSTPSASTLNQNTGFYINMDSYAMIGANPSFSSLTVDNETTLKGATNISGATRIDNDLIVSGNTNISGNTKIASGLNVTGVTNISGNTIITGNTNISGVTDITGDTTINGKLTVTDNTNISGNTTIKGNTNISGNTAIDKNLTVNSDTKLQKVSATTISAASETLSGDLNVSGNTNINTDLTVNGDTTLKDVTAKTINVSDNIQAPNISGTTIKGITISGGTLNVSGNTTLKDVTATTISATTSVKSPLVSATTINGVSGNITNLTASTISGANATITNLSATTISGGSTTIGGTLNVSGKTVFGGEVEFNQPVTIDLSACLTSTTIADGICEAFDRSVVTIERDSNPSDSGLSAVYKLYQDGVQITNSVGTPIDINVPKDGFLKNVELVNVSNTYYLRFTWNIYDADTQTYTTGSTDVSVEDLVKDIAANNSKSDRGVNVNVWYNETDKKMNVSAETTVIIKNNGGSGTKTFAKNGGTHTLSAYTLSYSHNGFSGKFDPFAANSSFTSPHSALTIDYGVVVTGKTDDSYDTSAAKTVSIPTKLSHITSAHTHPSSEITDIGNGKFTVSGNGTAVASTSANASANTGVNIVGDNLTVTPDASNKKITVGLTNINSQGTYKRVVVDAYGRVTSGDSSDANTNYYTTGLTVTTATTTSTINVKGNNAAVSGSAVISAATTSRAGVMTSTDKTKLNSITSGATKVASSSTNGHITIDGTDVTVYTHPTTSGNKHVPSGGSSGQFLGWSAAGTAAWVSNPNTDTATTYNGHYTPSAAAGGTKSASASGGGSLTWGSSLITGVTISGDAKGHYTAVAVSSAKLPSNPNTDSATTLNGHYTPTATTASTKSANASSTTALAADASVVTGVTLSGDAKGHITAVAVKSGKLAFLPLSGGTATGSITAPAFYASSDINLKHDINDVNAEEIAKANSVQFKSFKFNNDETDRKVYGVIAQEVQNADLNELVHTSEDGMLSVDYTSLLILKIASLEDYCKKLNDRISELESKLGK